MNKKIILISAGSIVFIAAVVIGGLVILKLDTAKPTTAVVQKPEDIKYSADGSRDYGACTTVDKSFVQSTLGGPAKDLQGPDTVGLATLPNGDQVQVCSYAFIKGGTAENQYNAANAFTIEVFLHKDEASKKAFIDLQTVDAKNIDGIADKASFVTRPFSDGATDYILIAYKNLRHYSFAIHQPAGVSNFTADQAQQKLTTIAQSVKY